jgi:hypothetical protein
MKYLREFEKTKQWLLQENNEPRSAPRSVKPVVVYCWDGGAPEGRRIRDVSQSGAYIYTPERWYVGTIIRIVLQGSPTIPSDRTRAPTSPAQGRGQAATFSWARNCGCQRRNTSSNSSFNTLVRVCSNRCAPFSVHCICCFLTKRRLTT